MKYKIKPTIGVKFLLSAASFISVVTLVFVFSYLHSKHLVEEEFNGKYNYEIETITKEISENILKLSHASIQTMLASTINTTDISYLKISYKNFFFSKETLIHNSNYTQNGDWEVNDIVTDVRNGTISVLEDNMYAFSSAKNFNTQEPIVFKFFLSKNEMLMNAMSKLYFGYESVKKDFNRDAFDKNETTDAFLSEKKSLSLLDKPFLEIQYIIDLKNINAKTTSLQKIYGIYYLLAIMLL